MLNDISYQLSWAMKWNSMFSDRPICQEPGCDRSAIECELMDNEGIHHEYFCNEHAGKNGFCNCCGIFIAGWIEVGNTCENCRDQMNIHDPDESDDNDYFYPDGSPY